jgi:hypothetical protein
VAALFLWELYCSSSYRVAVYKSKPLRPLVVAARRYRIVWYLFVKFVLKLSDVGEGQAAIPRDCDPRPITSMSPDRPTPFASVLFDRLRFVPCSKAFFFCPASPFYVPQYTNSKTSAGEMRKYSKRKGNENRELQSKVGWTVACRIWWGEDNLELFDSAPSKTDIMQGGAAPPEFANERVAVLNLSPKASFRRRRHAENMNDEVS